MAKVAVGRRRKQVHELRVAFDHAADVPRKDGVFRAIGVPQAPKPFRVRCDDLGDGGDGQATRRERVLAHGRGQIRRERHRRARGSAGR